MKKLFYFFIALFLASCTSNTIYKKPENLILRDTMVALLTDMYLASSTKSIKNKKLKRDVNYFPLIYNKYNIDSTRFAESNVYYMSVIETYNEMLFEVKDNLVIQKEKYAKEIKVLDSIKRMKKENLISKDSISKLEKTLSKEIDTSMLRERKKNTKVEKLNEVLEMGSDKLKNKRKR